MRKEIKKNDLSEPIITMDWDDENDESIIKINHLEKNLFEIEVDVREDPFQVSALLSKLDKSSDSPIIIDPDFQRNPDAWKKNQKSQFIESLLLNFPISPLFFNQTKDGEYITVDGVQRLTAIKEFLTDEFELSDLRILNWIEGESFSGLPKDYRARLKDRKIPCYVIKPSVPMYVVYEIFNRINTGGTKLNRMEIKNCLNVGKGTSLLKTLALSKDFNKAVDNGISDRRMKARELILRILSFHLLKQNNYTDSMDDFLTEGLRRLNKLEDKKLDQLKTNFHTVLNACFQIFEKNTFRLISKDRRYPINMCIAEATACYLLDNLDKIETLLKKKNSIMKKYIKLCETDLFIESIGRRSYSRENVDKRFKCIVQLMEESC